MRRLSRFAAAVALAALAAAAPAQEYGRLSDAAANRALAEQADVEMIAMVPMRDGVGLATNIYRPGVQRGRCRPSCGRRPTTSCPTRYPPPSAHWRR